MFARRISDLLPAEHARDFFDARLAIELNHARHWPTVGAVFLGDAVMLIAVRCDLRQVRDCEHLAALAKLLQQAADGVGDRAPDAGVDFIEDQRSDRRCSRCDHRDRQTNTRELASGCNTSERLRADAGVACDQELDLIDSLRGRLDST